MSDKFEISISQFKLHEQALPSFLTKLKSNFLFSFSQNSFREHALRLLLSRRGKLLNK
jgi:hypothetical protein